MTLFDILKIAKGKLINGELLNKPVGKLCIDSRKIEDGDIFVTLKGKNTNGTKYIKDVLNKASVIITDIDIKVESKTPIIKVKNTKKTIQLIGEYNRQKFINKPLIAITGSVGKTTTKELISHVLSTKYKVLKTKGNYNNDLGIPIMLSMIDNSYDIIVLELGMNHLKEIENLSKICKPDIAIITNIGTSHIGNLKSQKNIFKAKMEITNYLNHGILIVNGKDKFLCKVKNNKHYKVIKTKNIKHVKIYDKLSFKINRNTINFCIPNKYLIPNIMLCIETCHLFKISDKDIVNMINTFKPIEQRSNIIKLNNNIKLIDDCYNASQESVMASVDMLNNYKGKKILILGDILELGKYSKKIHKKLGTWLDQFKGISIITVGKHSKIMGFTNYDNNNDLINDLNKQKIKNTTILIKGSRGIHLEEIKNYFTQNYPCK
ncbi:MAG: UDP-N-acetylmuramoyl-tripeptide--D-alanyl-D-alanine ligase [Bacilli bacterium]|nr:UDP-N-acetylmuramoyl-tripeptide--D-alanyl-D-alanine ligase [Bacilli bacterium]